MNFTFNLHRTVCLIQDWVVRFTIHRTNDDQKGHATQGSLILTSLDGTQVPGTYEWYRKYMYPAHEDDPAHLLPKGNQMGKEHKRGTTTTKYMQEKRLRKPSSRIRQRGTAYEQNKIYKHTQSIQRGHQQHMNSKEELQRINRINK